MQHTAPDPVAARFDGLRLELRRGCLVVAVLAALRGEEYGYSLRKRLAAEGLDVDEGTLYPLLRRLESQGLLVSEWREDGRTKRFYRLSSSGAVLLDQLLGEWRALDTSLRQLMGEGDR